MSRYTQALGAAAAATVVLLASAALHAQQSAKSRDHEERTTRSGPSNMMRHMDRMMDRCDEMMQQGIVRPNDQWREPAPPQSGQTEQKR
jgi:hypothetical protein